jgi:hypothetical protein
MDKQAFKKQYAEVAALVVRPGDHATGDQLKKAVARLEKEVAECTVGHEHKLVEHLEPAEQHYIEECRRLQREIHNLGIETAKIGAKAKLAQTDRKLLGQIVDAIGSTIPHVIDVGG